VVVMFEEQLPPGLVRASALFGWLIADVPCPTGGGVCGVEWHTRNGVRPGDELSGFGLTYDSAKTPRQERWIVDVGRRRVQMFSGTVGE
jgi:hypothetical protein